jgi:hypothetical protein
MGFTVGEKARLNYLEEQVLSKYMRSGLEQWIGNSD